MLGGRGLQDEIRRIAERVKGWRLDAGLTLQDVSESAGVSASTVHKIENLQTVPTIAVLLKVAHGLGRKPHELFEDADAGEPQVALIRLGGREVLSTQEGTDLERVVGSIQAAHIDLWRVTHGPGCGVRVRPDAEPLSYNGEVVILVEAGRLDVKVGEMQYDLGPGDTLHFKTTLPHSWKNQTDEPVSAYFFGLLPEAARKIGRARDG